MMAVLMNGLLKGDGSPAFISQVVDFINMYPPVKAIHIHPAVMPGYMIGCATTQEWQERLVKVQEEIDARMAVLHNANLIWRKEMKVDREVRIGYYRRNERRKIVDLNDDLLWLPFHDIKPWNDERFPIVP